MKKGTLQKRQEPNPTHHRSEGPYHNLEKTRESNTVLHQYLINQGQAGTQNRKEEYTTPFH
jgi:hypothetical protein